MRERSEQIFKLVCLGLGVLLAVQLAKAVMHFNPLAGITIPELPSLAAETNAIASVGNKPSMKAETNSNASTPVAHTDTTAASPDTNPVAKAKLNGTASNSTSAKPPMASTALSTNQIATSTNAATAKTEANTNTLADSTKTNDSTAAPIKKHSQKNGNLPPGLLASASRTKSAKLPPEIQARVDRVTESEILGPAPHPMPMALLGIAGNTAFLRSPGGQTGLVKEGEDLGEIKLLQIGINRVLIEQNGEKKELMIFDGYGGESLLQKSTEPTNETTNRN